MICITRFSEPKCILNSATTANSTISLEMILSAQFIHKCVLLHNIGFSYFDFSKVVDKSGSLKILFNLCGNQIAEANT